jgi:lysophospholipase L1-like esterase
MKLLIRFSLFSIFLFSSTIALSVQLITLGDSLTFGEGDTQYLESNALSGYPGRLQQSLAGIYPDLSLHNLGRSGWTTSELVTGTDWDGPSQLNRALELINFAASSGEKTITLVWIGSNDVYSIFGWYENQSDLDEDVENYRTYINTILQALSQTDTDVYIALLDDQSKRPVLSSAAYAEDFESITSNELPLVSEHIAKYNAVITDLAHQYAAQTTDFFNTTLFEQSISLAEDGNHPNAIGYNEIASIWFNRIISPQIDLKINDNHTEITVQQGLPVQVNLNFRSQQSTGSPADWWLILAESNGHLFSYNLQTQMLEEGLNPTHQGELVDFSNLEIPVSTTDFSLGSYTLYFGVDDVQDGQLNGVIVYDWININLN